MSYTMTIDSDPSTLGPQATDGDVSLFASRLEDHLEQFSGETVRVRTARGATVNCSGPDDALAAKIEHEVERLCAGNEWVALLD